MDQENEDQMSDSTNLNTLMLLKIASQGTPGETRSQWNGTSWSLTLKGQTIVVYSTRGLGQVCVKVIGKDGNVDWIFSSETDHEEVLHLKEWVAEFDADWEAHLLGAPLATGPDPQFQVPVLRDEEEEREEEREEEDTGRTDEGRDRGEDKAEDGNA